MLPSEYKMMDMKADPQVVLLLEGDLPSAALYHRELSCDCSVLVCLTEAEAQSALAAGVPAAAVIEPAGLGARGWEMIARLVERNVPVIVCSTLDERKMGLELGATRYLVKPVLVSALLQAVREALTKPLNDSPPST